MSRDIRTKAFVLRRVNYGEADRILTLLTESGQVSAIAHSVRKEKSRLAGGIELFCLSDITYHEGKNNSLCTLTSSRLLEFYSNITLSPKKLELASLALKDISHASASSDGPEFFNLLKDTLAAINTSDNLDLIEVWFRFNFLRATGEEINVLRDVDGKPLSEDTTYVWDAREKSLRPRVGGNIGASEIKLLRFVLDADLKTTLRITDADSLIPSLIFVAKSLR